MIYGKDFPSYTPIQGRTTAGVGSILIQPSPGMHAVVHSLVISLDAATTITTIGMELQYGPGPAAYTSYGRLFRMARAAALVAPNNVIPLIGPNQAIDNVGIVPCRPQPVYIPMNWALFINCTPIGAAEIVTYTGLQTLAGFEQLFSAPWQ